MKKTALIDIVWQRLTGANTEDQLQTINEGLVEYMMGLVYSDILFKVWKSDPTQLGQYTQTYDSVSISQDSTTNIYYAPLPENILNFPDNQSGVRKVATQEGTGIDFVSSSNDDSDLMEGLECDVMSNHTTYIVKNGRVEFKNLDFDSISTVRMDLVIPFESYDYTDDIFLLSGQTAQIIQLSVQLLANQKPADLLNNQNPNIPTNE